MCRYIVPCRLCGKPILADQPDSSRFQIEEVECSTCHSLLKSRNDNSVYLKIQEMLQDGKELEI
jgi:hypothetical protein